MSTATASQFSPVFFPLSKISAAHSMDLCCALALTVLPFIIITTDVPSRLLSYPLRGHCCTLALAVLLCGHCSPLALAVLLCGHCSPLALAVLSFMWPLFPTCSCCPMLYGTTVAHLLLLSYPLCNHCCPLAVAILSFMWQLLPTCCCCPLCDHCGPHAVAVLFFM